METIVLKSNSKKDINLMINIAKKIGVDVQKISPKKKILSNATDSDYELKVDRNLGKLIETGLTTKNVSREEIMKALI